MGRLEAPFGARAPRPRAIAWTGSDPLERVRAEVGEREGVADETPRGGSDDDFVSGPASAWSRAARLGVSPTASFVPAVSSSRASPTTTGPVARPMRTASGRRRGSP